MEPDLIQFDLIFSAYTQVDTRNLSELALFAGSTGANYSGQLDSEFQFSRGGVNIAVSGQDFVYDGGVPVSGEVFGVSVSIGNAAAYSFGVQGYEDTPVLPISVFQSTDPLAIASVVFAGNDVIAGSPIADTLYGFTGDDAISGNSGDDLIYGEDGNDQGYGGNGSDKIYGGNGDDWLSGGKADDKLLGGDGSDTAAFTDKLSAVSVKLNGSKAVKAEIGATEIDKLKGIENVLGGIGKDKIIGDGQDNKLGGYSGDDLLKGKGGNDTLVGGWGSDTLTGGKGDDVFLFDKLPAGSGYTDIDTITDFGKGADTLHFDQQIFGELEAGVLSPDHFYAAPGAFAGIGETYFVYDTRSGILYYDGSGDGSGPVFQVAVLKGAPTLGASDIFVVPPPPEDLP